MEKFKSGSVFSSDVRDGDGCCLLLVDKLSEACLRLDERIRDFILLAESWQPDYELDGVHIGCYNDKFGLEIVLKKSL